MSTTPEPVIWAFEVPNAETEIQGLSVLVEVLDKRVPRDARTRLIEYLASRFDPMVTWTEDLRGESS